jgi:hypothetical protein
VELGAGEEAQAGAPVLTPGDGQQGVEFGEGIEVDVEMRDGVAVEPGVFGGSVDEDV